MALSFISIVYYVSCLKKGALSYIGSSFKCIPGLYMTFYLRSVLFIKPQAFASFQHKDGHWKLFSELKHNANFVSR